MRLAIMQPYFMPYIGYWQMMDAIDKFIIFDDVNYVKKGWINRNYLLVNGKASLFSISLHEASQNKLINEIEIYDDFSKLQKTIELAYKKAPFFEEVFQFLREKIFSYPENNLARFIGNTIIQTSLFLDMNIEFEYSSNLCNNKSLRASDKILDICKLLNANIYINAIGGRDIYDKNVFMSENIELFFLSPNILPYKQFYNGFVPSLSLIDVLMFNGKEGTKNMLKNYTLI